MKWKSKVFYCFCSIFLVSFNANSQSDSLNFYPIKLYTNAEFFHTVINDHLITNDSIIWLKPGAYKLTLFAEKLMPSEDSIFVKPFRINQFQFYFKRYKNLDNVITHDLSKFEPYQKPIANPNKLSLFEIYGDYEDISVLIDNKEHYDRDKILLTTGQHNIQIWTKNNKIIYDTITMDSDIVTQRSYEFEYSESYKSTYAQRGAFFRKRRLHITSGMLFSLASSAYLLTSVIFTKRNSDAYHDLYNVKYMNSYSVPAIKSYKNEFYVLYNQYKKWRNQVIVSSILTTMGVAYSIVFAVRFNEKRAPQYELNPPTWKKNLDIGFTGDGVSFKLNF